MKKHLLKIFFLITISISLYAQTIGTGAGHHTIAIHSDSTIYIWGDNAFGQLGNNSITNSSVPIAVTTSGALSGKKISAVATGNAHSIASASDGTVYTWGKNSNGQLGNSTNIDSKVPVAVTTSGALAGKIITAVAAGRLHTIALASDGTAYCWGYNWSGQLGNNSNTDSNVPVAVYTGGALSGKTITAVAAGRHHSMALTSDGSVYTWGENWSGQLGDSSWTFRNFPVAVTTSGALSGKTITAIAAGRFFCLALASDGTIYSWGQNGNGELGNNSNTNSNVPVAVYTGGALLGKTITAIAAGGNHSIALTSGDSVYTWGYNLYGELGNNSNTDSNIPVAVYTGGALSGKTITAVAAGDLHLITLTSENVVYTWGYNRSGQLGNNSISDSNVPVKVSGSPLPVELTSFNAVSINSATAVLNWTTATEVNNYGFEIEKMNDRMNAWSNIGFVEGHGNSNSPKEYSFVDAELLNGDVSYRLKQIDTNGKFEYSSVIELKNNLSKEYILKQNYPNPFNPTTVISYSIPTSSHVILKVFDVLGNEIATLVNKNQEVGSYKVNFDASHLSNGIYFYKISVGASAKNIHSEIGSATGFISIKKMILLK